MLNKVPFSYIRNKLTSKMGESFPEKVYLASLFLLLIFFNTTSTTFDISKVAYLPQTFSLCRYFLLFVIILKAALLSDYTVKEFLIMGSVGVILLISAYNTGENALLFSYILIIGAKNCNLKRIAKVYFYTYIGIVIFVFILYFLGILPEFGMYRGDSARFAMGFNHPNLLGRLILVIIISGLIIYKDKLTRIHYVIALLLIAFVYIIPQCRSVVLCLAGLLILLLFEHLRILNNKFIKALMFAAIPLFAILSLVAAMLYNPDSEIWLLINSFSSGRIYYSNLAYKMFGYTSLLGQNIVPFLDDITLIVDNCYVRLITEFGVLALYLFCHFNVVITKKAFKNKRFDIAIIIVIMGFFGIFEFHSYVAVYNIALLTYLANID